MCWAQRARWIGKLIEQCDPGPSFPCDPSLCFICLFAWNYRELANSLLTLGDGSEGGFEPRTLRTRVKGSNHSAIPTQDIIRSLTFLCFEKSTSSRVPGKVIWRFLLVILYILFGAYFQTKLMLICKALIARIVRGGWNLKLGIWSMFC